MLLFVFSETNQTTTKVYDILKKLISSVDARVNGAQNDSLYVQLQRASDVHMWIDQDGEMPAIFKHIIQSVDPLYSATTVIERAKHYAHHSDGAYMWIDQLLKSCTLFVCLIENSPVVREKAIKYMEPMVKQLLTACMGKVW